jgi:uncharacterized protein (TIGR03000 family)
MGWQPVYSMPIAPAAPPVPPEPTPEPVPKPKPVPEPGSAAAPRARLIVEVPADAKLFIDDQLMKTPDARRVFNTPTLAREQAYYYIVRAEVVRDGKTYSETKRVIVRAGQEVKTAFPELADSAIARAVARAGK